MKVHDKMFIESLYPIGSVVELVSILARIDEECGPLGFDEYIQEDVVMEIMKAIGNFDIEVEISDVDEETGEITYNLYQ